LIAEFLTVTWSSVRPRVSAFSYVYYAELATGSKEHIDIAKNSKNVQRVRKVFRNEMGAVYANYFRFRKHDVTVKRPNILLMTLQICAVVQTSE